MKIEMLNKMRNYKNSKEGKMLLIREFKNYFQNYKCKINKEFLDIAYEYLTDLDNYLGVEYRFLSWLKYSYNYSTNINQPYVVEPEFCELEKFKMVYLFSNKRNQLFNLFIKYIAELKQYTELDSIRVLVGGSFSEINKNDPKDIDIIILVPLDRNKKNELHENYQYASKRIPIGIDAKFLPEDYCFKRFKAYSNIVCLGNNAQNRDKDEPFVHNSFVKRKIIRIEL